MMSPELKSNPLGTEAQAPSQSTTDKDAAASFLAAHGLEDLAIDQEAERRLLWKIDLMLMPLLCITFGLQYYDKAVFSSASIFGIIHDMDLSQTYGNPPVTSTLRYSTANAAFYWGYLAATMPMTWILQRYPLGKTLGLMVVLWGLIVLTTLAVHSYPGIVVQRVVLGAIESSVSPGFVILTSAWYKKSEQPVRLGIWYAATGLFSIFSGVVNYGLGKAAHGSTLATWKAMYIFAGSWTVVWGVLLFFVLPDNPMSARFLSLQERRLAVERLRQNMTGIENKKFKKYQFMEGLADVKIWMFFLMGAAIYITNGGMTAFGAIIVKSFGYTSLQTILLLTPGGATTVVSIWIFTWLAGRFRNITTLLIPVSCIPVLTGAIVLWKYDWSHRGPLLLGYYLLGIFGAPYVLLLSLSTANVAGHTKKSLSAGAIFVGYNVGNIIAPYLVDSTTKAKHFPMTWIAVIFVMSFTSVCSLVLRVILKRENVRRDRVSMSGGQALHGWDEEENTKSQESPKGEPLTCHESGFEDLTDKENKAFRYSL